MGKIAFVFAGQGAQFPGMGRELYDTSAAARRVFELAERLRPGTLRQCFEGSAEELAQTCNTQPCLFAMDLACARALEEAGVRAEGAAGFSLGELPALAFAGVLEEEQAFRLVCERARLMQACAAREKGGMLAALKLQNETVEALCEMCGVYPVNYNCPGQLVVAGSEPALADFAEKAAAQGARCVRLAVGGAFHSPLMTAAAKGLEECLRQEELRPPMMPIYANATASPYGEDAKSLLARQVCSPVRWQQTIAQMAADGFDTFFEVGAGKTLTGLIKKIDRSLTAVNVQDPAGVQAAAEQFGGIR